MKKIIIGLIAGIIIGLLMAAAYTNRNPAKTTKTTTSIDTVIIIKEREPLIIEKVRAVIKYKRDTVILSKPFKASLDTIIKHDTIRAEYDFPENLFSLKYKFKADSSRNINTVKIYEKQESTEWLINTGYFLAGIAGGFLLHSIIK